MPRLSWFRNASPHGQMHTQMMLGIGAAVLGALTLIYGISVKMNARAEAERPDPENEDLKKKITTCEQQIAKCKEDAITQGQLLLTKQSENKKTEERNKKAELELAAKEKEKDAKIDTLRKAEGEVREKKRKASEALESAKLEDINSADHQQRVQQIAAVFQRVLVTVFSTEGQVTTGFFVIHGRHTVVVTARTVLPKEADGEILIKFRYQLGNSFQVGMLKGRMLMDDTNSGLCLLGCEIDEDVPVRLSAVPSNMIAETKVGTHCYEIAAQVLGLRLLENSIFDGEISNTDRQVDGQPRLQTTLPANPGSSGAPIINAEGKIIGVMMGQMGELEHSSSVIPGKVLLNLLDAFARKVGQ